MHTLRLRRHGLVRNAFQIAACICLMLALGSQTPRSCAGESAEEGGSPSPSNTDADRQAGSQHGANLPPVQVPPQPPPRVDAAAPANRLSELDSDLPASYVARKQYLNNFLIRNRDYRILVTSAAEALTTGDEQSAIEALQAIWEAPEDVLVWDDARQCPVSAREQADQIMRHMDHAARDAYERCYGSLADLLLNSILENHDVASERELLRRFGHTRSAGRLLELKAQQAMDRGELCKAVEFWQRLLADPWQHHSIDMSQAADALSLCERLGSKMSLTIDNGAALASHDLLNVSAPVAEPLWTSSFLAEANRNQETIRLVAGDDTVAIDETLVDVVESWMMRQQNERLPLGGTSTPVMSGDLVILRDFSGVTARGARSGEVKWRYECETSLCGILTDMARAGGARFPERRHQNSAAELFSRCVADHSVLSSMTTDGERVYLIDGIRADDPNDGHPEAGGDSSTAGRPEPLLRNRLMALSIHGPEQGNEVWSRGGPKEDSQSGLGDFYFLGPPRPHNGGLYAMGEEDDQLQVVVLDATSGATRWRQSISLVETPVSESRVRSRTACSPLVSQGIVVCPTQMPVLVGMDELTGMLLWVYHAAGEERPDSAAWHHHGRRSEPDDHPSQPVIIGSRMLFLPPDSSRLHCIDLVSGQRLWCEEASQAQFVAGADDGIVMLVTSQECIGFCLESGALRWRTPIDAPAGRGVAADGAYLLPLNSGQLAEICFADGTLRPNLLASRPSQQSAISLTFPLMPTASDGIPSIPAWFCGNLAIHDDLVVCSSSTGVSVFPQARAILDTLPSGHSADSPVSPSDALHRAELHIRLGENSTAIRGLRSLLAIQAPDSTRERATEYLRELLYLDFATRPGSQLEELAELVSTPPDVARYLLNRLEHELNSGQLRVAIDTACAIRDLQLNTCVRMDHVAQHMVVPLEHARFLLEQFIAALDENEVEFLRDTLRLRLGVDHESDPHRLREALVLLGGWSRDDSLSRRIAGRLHAAGELQAAELVMLRYGSGRAGRVSDANPLSLRSWSPPSTGVPIQSSRPSAQLTLQHRMPPSAIDYVASYRSTDDEVRFGVARFEEPQAIPAVDIIEVEHHGTCFEMPDDCPCSLLPGLLSGRSHFVSAAGTTVRLIDREERAAAESVARFAVFDRDGITELGAIDMPPARWRLPEAGRYDAGHLIPLQGKGVLMLSLLERRHVWHAQPDTRRGSGGPHLGPYGHDFCVLQSGQELTVVDPATGHPLWQRRGLRFGAGLEANAETGIIGDSQVLVVFDSDRIGYELFETRSGSSLRRGQLPVSPTFAARKRTNFGRRLMYQTEVEGVPHFCIWDPLEDRLLLDAQFDRRFHSYPFAAEQRVALLNADSLKSINGRTGDCQWELTVDGEHLDHVRDVLMFTDGDVDFVLLDRHMRDSQSSTASLDIRIPSEELSGELYALDRTSGVPVWNSPLPIQPSRVLNLQQHQLPFLVTLSRVRDPRDNDSYRLKIDVIDIATGRVVGSNSNLANIPILHTTYDDRNQQLTLWGPENHIEIRYSLLTVSRH